MDQNQNQPLSESYLMCNKMMDSVFKKHRANMLFKEIQNLPMAFEQKKTNTISTQTKSIVSYPCGTGYSAVKYLR